MNLFTKIPNGATGMDFFSGLPTEDSMGRPIRRSDPAERLRERLHPDGECLVFTGSRNANGYGRLSCASTVYLAHRLAWMIANDAPVPDGMCVLHSCDNPPCCNPDHIRIGTPAENSADMKRRKRGRNLSGEDNPRTRYDTATVERVRALTVAGVPTKEVAERTGVKADYVRKLARGDRRRKSAPGPIDRRTNLNRQLPYEQIANEYEAGATTTELAAKYGTHPGNVSRIVRKMGVRTRSAWESRRRRHDNPTLSYESGWLLRAER